MDRYQKVEKPRSETPLSENEIRVTNHGKVQGYISYALLLFQEKGASEIVLKAMGKAMSKTVAIVEIVKRRIVGLHQNTSIATIDMTDLWHPREESNGLLPFETTRPTSLITITLSTKELDTSSPGYQPPLPANQVKACKDFKNDGGQNGNHGRRRGQGWNRVRVPNPNQYVRRGPRGHFGCRQIEDNNVDMGDDANAIVHDTTPMIVDTAP